MSKADVFISYSQDAKAWAGKLSESLERKGVSTWTDFKSIRAGQRWFEEIQRALDDASYFLIVVGPKNRIGEWQDREWQGALERTWTDPKKRIIPVLVEDAKPPSFLKNWVPVRIQSKKSESSWIDPIYNAIQGTGSEGPGSVIDRDPKPDKEFRARLQRIERFAKQLTSSQEE